MQNRGEGGIESLSKVPIQLQSNQCLLHLGHQTQSLPYLLNGDLMFGISVFYSYIAIGFLYLPLKNDWIDEDRYMYKDSYLNQDVAIRVLKDEHMKLEFA